MKVKLLHFWILMMLPLGAAVSIEWASDLNVDNRESDGITPLDAGFEFVLGAFVGITPGPENVDRWEEAFVPFGSAAYSVEFGSFSSSKVLVSNEAPFTPGSRAYLWGRNGTASGSEWILISRSSWTWPQANPVGPPPFPVRWLTTLATGPEDVILGSVNEGGFHLQTERVEFMRTYEDWASLRFTEGEAGAAEEDFDEDGRSNFLEYALGSDPRITDRPFDPEWSGGGRLTVPRVPGRQVDFHLQSSNGLIEFATMTSGFELLTDDPDRLVFQITDFSAGRKFFRLLASPLE